MITKQTFRERAYACYISGFKGESNASHHGESPAALKYRRYLKKSLSPWLQNTPRQAVIADLGCGDGMLLRVFQELGFTSLEGVDGSPEMVCLCQKHFPAVQLGDINTYLDNKPERYDVVALFDVLEHFTKEEGLNLLDKIANTLKPNGLLLLQLPNGDSPFTHSVFSADLTHESLYTRSSLAHLLAMAGMHLQSVDEHSPEPLDTKSTIRFVLWKTMRAFLHLAHRIETGGASSGVYTRVMRGCARKK